MSPDNTIRPKICLLTGDQMEQIHEYALDLLSTTGIQVDSEKARGFFAQEISFRKIEDKRVTIPRELVEHALKTAPATINFYDRKGNFAFALGGERMRFGIGVTALYYQEPQNDSVVQFTRKHMEQMVQLGNQLPNYDAISTVGVIQDLPADVADLYAALEMMANTTKPLIILVSDVELFPKVLELMEHLQGDLVERPFVIPYFNPITPLVLDPGTADKMIATIERGLPFIYSNYSMAGVSSPITPAGNLVLLTAELLAGLTLSQLIKEGTPVILGSLPNMFDMKTMVSFYDPSSILMSLACSEMMAFYQVPHCGTSGSGTGWGPDFQAADSYWLNTLTGIIGKSGMAPFIGDTLGAKAFSPINIIYAHEIIDQALRFSQGFVLDEATVGLDEINQVGPGGHFLMAKQTMKYYKEAYYTSPIFPRWSMEKWQAEGQPNGLSLLREYTLDLMSHLSAPADHSEMITKGEAFIQAITS